MQTPSKGSCTGIVIRGRDEAIARLCSDSVLQHFNVPDLSTCVVCEVHAAEGTHAFHMCLHAEQTAQWAPGYNTLGLCSALQIDTRKSAQDLIREVVVAMLMAPQVFEFPSLAELLSAVRIRCNVVRAARVTSLAFQTSVAERPDDCWVYDEEQGFIVRPDMSLVAALTMATQPEFSGTQYSFSCYRASEYVLLLGIAQELQQCNPDLYWQLQSLWTRRSIKSGAFHEVFLREQGSMDKPLPPYYFVPGDRIWFRNPDEASADASGFEGSWLMYLGGGLFSNFWKHDQPYTLEAKCLEIYHWRDGLYFDADGEQRIDECKVAGLIEHTRQNPTEMARVLELMQRYREPRGVYTQAGGCLDTTREFARWVCPGTTDLVLPTD